MIAAGSGEIHVGGLTRSFGSNLAVRPFELAIGPGGITGLLGPNGSGKTTLLRMLIGLVPPDTGEASVDGVALAGDGTAIRRRVTYMPGEIAVYGELKGSEHLRWSNEGRDPGALERSTALARELELPLERRVRGYSHGMKRMLHLCAALGPDVRVRILDEPTDGLDPTKRGAVLELLRAEALRGVTILLSSHHLGEVDRGCDRILFLNRGELLDDESSKALHQRARRVVRLTWEDPDVAAAMAERLQAQAEGEVRVDRGRVTLTLADDDPVNGLRRLLSDADLARPASLVYGELSLQELYRELYGTEGI